jgi:hypothetical protein
MARWVCSDVLRQHPEVRLGDGGGEFEILASVAFCVTRLLVEQSSSYSFRTPSQEHDFASHYRRALDLDG